MFEPKLCIFEPEKEIPRCVAVDSDYMGPDSYILLSFPSGGELIIVIVAILILFGADKIPEFARMFGKGMREFRRATEDIKREFNEETREIREEIETEKQSLTDKIKEFREELNTEKKSTGKKETPKSEETNTNA
ncbi:twin-arginine translocase TatA/TatE family subunit [Saccharicrinis sp. FJH2]|uniref:twin-arginine translocase TatA/TatE family subunit n=1 Tax=Saccharicrinis sp. FJH65 TaxID=3344659 RepID=UPI0035F2C02D